MARFSNIDFDGQTTIADYCDRTGNGSSTFDLCKSCGKQYAGKALTAVHLKPYNGEPSGRLDGGDVEHPDYRDDPDLYECEACGRALTSRDN